MTRSLIAPTRLNFLTPVSAPDFCAATAFPPFHHSPQSKLWHMMVVWLLSCRCRVENYSGDHGEALRNIAILKHSLSALLLLAIAAGTAFAAGREPLKSYDIESKVYNLCR